MLTSMSTSKRSCHAPPAGDDAAADGLSPAALDILVANHQRFLSFLERRVGRRDVAEEIVQDAMLAVWRGAGSFRGESSVRSWVIAIARRQTRDRLRGRRLRVVDDAFLADQPGSGPGPEATALDRAELAEVTGAIRDLAPPHRELLGLAFGSGLSLPEVAAVLEIPVGTVKSRLTAARTALNRILNEKGQNR